ncbi:hypothetical protein [Deinococcus marmoris]|nr:hypothetical protein [Deinococcus marmoris]
MTTNTPCHVADAQMDTAAPEQTPVALASAPPPLKPYDSVI